jgi:hypothetical protein
MQAQDGKMSAQCFHNGCAGRGWQEFKEKIGRPSPQHYDPPLRTSKSGVNQSACSVSDYAPTTAVPSASGAGDQGSLGSPATTGVEDTPEGLCYREGSFTVTVAKQERSTKWRIVVARGEEVLGGDCFNPADAKARRALIRSLKNMTGEETEALDKVLLRLSVSVERDWAEYERRSAAEQLQQAQEKQARADAQKQGKRQQWLREVESRARPLLADPALLYRIGEGLRGRGLVGERRNGLVLYLCVVSQITDEPISAVVKGDSSGGKSHLVKIVLVIVPDESHIDLTSMSEKALIYDDRDYAHRTVVIYEVHGQGNEFTTYLIRTLISEGEIRHLTVESTPLGLVSRQIVKQGPTNFITTTTMPELHAENETRIWTIMVDDSPRTTKLVLAAQADKARGVFQAVAVEDLHAAYSWLKASGVKTAVVPFADMLAAAMPDRPLRLRRDFPRLLQLIEVCALLHQQQRQLDDQGRVVADLADYAIVRELVAPIFLRAIAGITEKTMELVKALKRVLDKKSENGGNREKARASYSDLVEATGKPKHYISRWLRPALEIGIVDNENAGEKGRPASLKMGKYTVEEGGDVLPVVAEIARSLKVDVRWVSPLTGREEVLQCCNTDCNGMNFTQVSVNEQVSAKSSGSVAALQGGEGSLHARAPLGLTVACKDEEAKHPSPACNTTTLSPSGAVSQSASISFDNYGPLQSELQRSATLSSEIPAARDRAREVFEL